MQKLKEALGRSDAVIFVGSGMSCWSGLPNWKSLLENLADELDSLARNSALVRRELSANDLLQAASYGFDQLTPMETASFLRRVCKADSAQPHEAHRKLLELGPRSFITTNYDPLIERAILKWCAHLSMKPVVTNRHLVEVAEIITARATNFIFKIHGDLSDQQSIIITREHYRLLLPHGERHFALEALKTLLVSRPIVYVGFGLRDPDFMFLRDTLSSLFKGGVNEHFAIMPDVSTEEETYWRKNFGIHLIAYETTIRPDGSTSHDKLLDLLDSLSKGTNQPTTFEANSAATQLELARYSARLARLTSNGDTLGIRVKRYAKRYEFDRFDHSRVEHLLANAKGRVVLVGLPGAGKTFSLQQAVARLATEIQDQLISAASITQDTPIPIIADMKLYKGSMEDLVSSTLPVSLKLKDLLDNFNCRIFIDSFNEAPRELLESGHLRTDLNEFLRTLGSATTVLASRTTDGLPSEDFPTYELAELEPVHVESLLETTGINIEGRFKGDVISLLQRPFYLDLFRRNRITIADSSHPKDIYHSYFEILEKDFFERFGFHGALTDALSKSAFIALNHGTEAISLSVLEGLVGNVTKTKVDPRDAINWLVSRQTITPFSGSRFSFIHQSMTEYLAALELSREYVVDSEALSEKITRSRWDQSIFLALSLLSPEKAEVMLAQIVDWDFELALNAVRFLETGRDEVVAKLIEAFPGKASESNNSFRVTHALGQVPIANSHTNALWVLAEAGGEAGQAAIEKLIEFLGESAVRRSISLLIAHREDYNFCANGIGRNIAHLISIDHLREIKAEIDKIIASENPSLAEIQGLTSGVSYAAASALPEAMRDIFIAKTDSLHPIFAEIVCDYLWKQASTSALSLALEVLERGYPRAAVSIEFILSDPRSGEVDRNVIQQRHVSILVTNLDAARQKREIDGDERGNWEIKALRQICLRQPSAALALQKLSEGYSGLFREALRVASGLPADIAFVEIENIAQAASPAEDFWLIRDIELNWAGREEIFLKLLKLRMTEIAKDLIEPLIGPDGTTLSLPSIGPAGWWLDWLDGESDFFFRDRLSWLFKFAISDSDKAAFLAEFNQSQSPYRKILASTILLARDDLTTEHFSDSAIEYLLDELRKGELTVDFFNGNLLCRTATEEFAETRLVPLLNSEVALIRKSVVENLQEIGKRVGRRFVRH